MRALIKRPVTLSCLPGSTVEISEGQFRALRDSAVAIVGTVAAIEMPEDMRIAETAEKPKRRRNTKDA